MEMAKKHNQKEIGESLGEAIAFLEKNYPDEVIRVSREVNPIFEVTAILAKLEKMQQFPCVIFENVKGSKIPLVTNMHASFPRLAMAIGLPYHATPADFIHEYGRREANPIPTVMVDSGPCQEVVFTGDEVDVTQLPILQYHELDAGQYITLAYDVMKDPDTGIRNAGVYRLQLKGKNKFGIQISETAHGHYILKKNKMRGQATQMAAVIGCHPAMNIGNLSFTSIDTDEFTIAGAMLGKPVNLVKCKTIDIEVPAAAEIVLECEIHPTEEESEAPFGEYPGTYGPERINPVVYVKAMTMRRNALYQSSFVGHADNLLLSGVTRNSYIYHTCRIASAAVKAVYVPPCGRSRYFCFIQMSGIIEGDPKNAAMAAFTADPFLKFVVVVDEDVDISNDSDVLHAIATRVRADRDVFMVTYSRGSPLDPASYDPPAGSHLVTKVGIDATRKPNYPKEIMVPGTDSINLSDYFGDRFKI
jgi:2,5-furandicarboxylate decarboxylase 1